MELERINIGILKVVFAYNENRKNVKWKVKYNSETEEN